MGIKIASKWQKLTIGFLISFRNNSKKNKRYKKLSLINKLS